MLEILHLNCWIHSTPSQKSLSTYLAWNSPIKLLLRFSLLPDSCGLIKQELAVATHYHTEAKHDCHYKFPFSFWLHNILSHLLFGLMPWKCLTSCAHASYLKALQARFFVSGIEGINWTRTRNTGPSCSLVHDSTQRPNLKQLVGEKKTKKRAKPQTAVILSKPSLITIPTQQKTAEGASNTRAPQTSSLTDLAFTYSALGLYTSLWLNVSGQEEMKIVMKDCEVSQRCNSLCQSYSGCSLPLSEAYLFFFFPYFIFLALHSKLCLFKFFFLFLLDSRVAQDRKF